ncbi:MAG: dephospho-CoA kinase [Bacteriovorax sp.]|jgi:dephospho-CoA kinase|nr:dephospho-CoA kinase [Bacteriovorax sp.]
MKKLKSNFIKLTPATRLYHIPVPIIGLTGGIGTGKSTVAALFKDEGIPVIDADVLVKNIYQKKETKDFIKQHFPSVIDNEQIQFKKLREIVFSNEEAKKLVENFIYALMPDEFHHAFSQFNNPSFIVYDVPLLFEKQLHQLIDLSICVYSTKEMQMVRVMKRDHIDRELAEKIIEKQMDIEIKRSLADFQLENIRTPEELKKHFHDLFKSIT